MGAQAPPVPSAPPPGVPPPAALYGASSVTGGYEYMQRVYPEYLKYTHSQLHQQNYGQGTGGYPSYVYPGGGLTAPPHGAPSVFHQHPPPAPPPPSGPPTLPQFLMYQNQQWMGHQAGLVPGGPWGEFSAGIDYDRCSSFDEEMTSVGSGKQSVARRRHARRRRQLARLAAEREEWEGKSREMEDKLVQMGLLQKESETNLFTDLRKTLARALLLTTAVVDPDKEHKEPEDDMSDLMSTFDSEVLSDTDSEDLTRKVMAELRITGDVLQANQGEGKEKPIYWDPPSTDAGANPMKEKEVAGEETAAVAEKEASRYKGCEKEVPPHRHDSSLYGSYSSFLSGFQPVGNNVSVSPFSKSAFTRCAGIEAVVGLEHALLKAQETGLFLPGELLVTAVTTKDMLMCYASGGCLEVLGASAQEFIHTSLFDGIDAEDVSNLVFAFHLFPTILPEICAHKEGEGKNKDNNNDDLLPLSNSVRLLPHGYVRRRLTNGTWVSMERLGGVIIMNDALAKSQPHNPPAESKDEEVIKDKDVVDGELTRQKPGGTGYFVEKEYPGLLATSSSEGEGEGEGEGPGATRASTPFDHGKPRSDLVDRSSVSAPLISPPKVFGRPPPPPGGSPPSLHAGSSSDPNVDLVNIPGMQKPIKVVLNKYHPSLKPNGHAPLPLSVTRSSLSAPHGEAIRFSRKSQGGASGFSRFREKSIPKASLRSPSFSRRSINPTKTSETEIESLVAHCVKHSTSRSKTEATGKAGVAGDMLPDHLKDVLRRLSRDTFSENTMIISVERVNDAPGVLRDEARHNAAMMLVSKLLNDLATQRKARR